MTVEIELAFDTPPQDATTVQLVSGQLRIFVDGACLTEHREERWPDAEWQLFDLDGNPVANGSCSLVGEHLTMHVVELMEAVLTVARRELEEFEQLAVELSTGAGSRYAITLSTIDERYARIAYQHHHQMYDDLAPATLSAARGYAVSLADLCAGAADAVQTYCTYLERAIDALEAEGMRDYARSRIDQLEPAIEELRTYEQRYR